MLVAGAGIPVMAALNSGLGTRLQNPALATCILFLVGLILAIILLMFSDDSSRNPNKSSVPWHYYFGGVFVIFYIFSVTKIAPIFGIANTIAFVLVGQLIAMTLIDHFGFLGAQKFSITVNRFIGLLLMSIGVLLVVSRPAMR